jgi:ATP:ADP antiporter, AAA family
MKAMIARTLHLQPQETNLVLVLGCLLLSNSLARQISDVVAVSGFLSTVGVNQILLVWLVDMVLTIVVTALQSLIVDRFNRINLIAWMSFSYAILLLLLRLMFAFKVASGLNYTMLYLLAEQQLLFFPIVFWILANDLLSLAQAKRLFPLIATGNFAGQIMGLGIAAIAPSLLHALGLGLEELLTFNVLIYLLAYVLVTTTLGRTKIRRTARKPETAIETLTEGWGFVREVPSFRYLMMAIIGINVCLTIFEFRFLVVTNVAFSDIGSYQRFYSLFRLGLIMLSFATQGFLTSRIIGAINLKNSFFMLPVAQLLASVGMIIMPGVMGGVSCFALSKLTQYTVDESARKSFQSLVPEERRGRVSLFMDSYLFAIGTIIGSLLTGAIILVGIWLRSSNNFYAYLAVAVLTSMFTIWSISKMRAVYDSSLFNWRLKRRQRGASVLDKLDF